MASNKLQHTPEPWVQNNRFEIRTADMKNIIAAGLYTLKNGKECSADISRIVTCVNACAGMTNEQVERIPQMLDDGTKALDECARLRFKNEEMRKALESVSTMFILMGVNNISDQVKEALKINIEVR